MAAGMGKRMMPLTKNIPKPMLPIHGKPILERIINILPREIEEIILIIGYQKEKITNYFGDSFNNRKIKYIVQEKAEGTWKALKLAERFLEGEDKFLLLNADDLHSEKSLQELINEKNAILAYEHQNPERFGVLEIDSENNLLNVEEKPEKPKTNLVAVGVYVLEYKFLKFPDPEPVNGEYYLTPNLMQFAQKEKVKVIKSKEWIPIGNPTDYINAHDILAG